MKVAIAKKDNKEYLMLMPQGIIEKLGCFLLWCHSDFAYTKDKALLIELINKE